jgi:hypothetical protein
MIRIGSTITILGLWSIAIAIAIAGMDKLQLEHVELVLPHLEKCVAERGMQLPEEKLDKQFQQVLLASSI